MRYVSLFSGIEAASVAWEPLGWEPVAFAEIEPFPCAVLEYRFPKVPNLGDVTKIDWSGFIERYGAVDIVCGGSPCQSFSIAGGRESLQGESALCFEYWRAVRDLRPNWFLWENVPGVLSTRDNAFGQFLWKMEELGYGMAWRTLDAQFFGVAQRRRRVFLVGHLGDMRAAAVLFERESVRGNTVPSRKKREELARAAEERPHICLQGSMIGRSDANCPQGSGINEDVSFTLNTTDKHAVVCMSDGQAHAKITHDMTATLNCMHEQPIVCMSSDSSKAAIDEDVAGTLHVGGGSADDCCGPLCARDYKGVGNQYVQEGKLICERKY